MDEVNKKLDLIYSLLEKEIVQKNHLEKVSSHLQRSQDVFEKRITYISAGALAISLTLVEKVLNFTKCECKELIIGSWFFLTLSLMLNLISHYVIGNMSQGILELYSKKSGKLSKAKNQIEQKRIKKMFSKKINLNVRRLNNTSDIFNFITIVSLSFGIFLCIVFVSFNICK